MFFCCCCCCCSVAQSCLTLCDPMDCSMPGFPILHHLPELAQTHVHWVGDVTQPSHPLSPPSPPALNLSQHQSLFQSVSSSHQVARVLELHRVSLIFFSKSFIILALHLKIPSLNYFFGMWCEVLNSSLHIYIDCCHSTICWKDYPFPWNHLAPLSKMYWPCMAESSHCSPETITLLIDYIPIQNKKF